MADFFKKLFGQGNTTVKPVDPLTKQGLQAEDDLWNNNVAVRDAEGAQKMQDEAQKIGAEQIPVVQQQGGNEKKA